MKYLVFSYNPNAANPWDKQGLTDPLTHTTADLVGMVVQKLSELNQLNPGKTLISLEVTVGVLEHSSLETDSAQSPVVYEAVPLVLIGSAQPNDNN